MTDTDGKLVQLESGGWAQYRRLTVKGLPSTLLVAVELTEEEARKFLADAAKAPTVH